MEAGRELQCQGGVGILERLWREFGPVVLPRWAAEEPGFRPSLWWTYDTSKVSLRSLGGPDWGRWRSRGVAVGMPPYECTAPVPAYRFATPASWLTRDLAEALAGLSGARRPFAAVPIDPEGPLLFESQAAHLEQHGLVLPGERKRLGAADLERVAVLERMQG